MDKSAMSTLISDSDSDGATYRIDHSNGARLDGLMVKNRRHTESNKNKCRVALVIVLSLSLLFNVIMTFAIIVLATRKTTTNCPMPSNSSSQIAIQMNTPQISSETSHKTTTAGTTCSPSTTTASVDVTEATQSTEVQQAQFKDQDVQTPGPIICPKAEEVPVCGKPQKLLDKERLEMQTKNSRENIFADLTSSELTQIYEYLHGQKELKVGSNQQNCHVYGIELHVPNKTQALLFLDSYGPKPVREARVVVACGHQPVPLVYEYVVGPLPKPSYYKANPRRRKNTVPYRFHPPYGLMEAYRAVSVEFGRNLDEILNESYGARFYRSKCGNKCIIFLPQRTSSAYTNGTLVILSAYYKTEFVTINPLDFMVVVEETVKGNRQFHVSGVFYGGQHFKSTPEFLAAYNSGRVTKTKSTFPKAAEGETSIKGTLNLRGPVFPSEPQAGPREFEPEGKRYSIDGQHVRYLQWEFNLRMSTASGPQVWDVRWAGERIAYEISLQDVGVIYAGANPTTFYTHLSDSAFGLGNKATGLLPGVDCPDHATFLSQVVFEENAGRPGTLPYSQCIFEHNTGRPLRRHRNKDFQNGLNHGGLMDRVLIVRSIIVEFNYDYIFDTVFHQNGAVELKTYASGYVMSQLYRPAEDMFGFRIHQNIVGSIHHHIFNFKVDLDIQGESNRYETLDLVTDDRKWPWYKSNTETFKQISFKHNLKKTEMEALLRYDFSRPKYHIVYNEEKKNVFGNHKAYRIDAKGFSKQILPDDHPALNSRRWSKYQIAVTRRKDEEESSSSIFSMYDGEDPHVDIDRYLNDDESTLDEDLVFWVTVGMHHIPHTEDIPNTPTVGTEATISLMPYNYFNECPSVGSRDSIRTDSQGAKVLMKDYGVSLTSHCLPASYDYENLFQSRTILYS